MRSLLVGCCNYEAIELGCFQTKFSDTYFNAVISNSFTGLCVCFSPTSTAMTLGTSQAEAEGLLEDRRGDMYTSLSVTGKYTNILSV